MLIRHLPPHLFRNAEIGRLETILRRTRSNGHGAFSRDMEISPERLYATVYKPGPGDPADFDQEANDPSFFESAGLDPKIHVVTGGKRITFDRKRALRPVQRTPP